MLFRRTLRPRQIRWCSSLTIWRRWSPRRHSSNGRHAQVCLLYFFKVRPFWKWKIFSVIDKWCSILLLSLKQWFFDLRSLGLLSELSTSPRPSCLLQLFEPFEVQSLKKDFSNISILCIKEILGLVREHVLYQEFCNLKY